MYVRAQTAMNWNCTPNIIYMLKSQSQMWWILWKIISFGWGHESGALMMRLAPLWEETPENLLFLSIMWEHSKKVNHLQVIKRALPTIWPCWKPNLWFPASSWLNHPIYRILLWQPKLTKMHILLVFFLWRTPTNTDVFLLYLCSETI